MPQIISTFNKPEAGKQKLAIMFGTHHAPSNASKTHHWVLFLLSTLVFLLNPSMQLALAGCRLTDGTPLCCRGKNVDCYGYTVNYEYNSNTSHSYTKDSLQQCFCDENCMQTKDCCPDYRLICQKHRNHELTAVNCHVSEWGPWTECDRDCDRGWKRRYRKVVQSPKNGGQYCPVLKERKSCQGYRCSSRRVGRSGSMMAPYMFRARTEVAHLLPLPDDVLGMTRQYDMRWDVRRKLYLGRLIKQNKTEQPDPDPYCVSYEITHASSNCDTGKYLRTFQTMRNEFYNNPYEANRKYGPFLNRDQKLQQLLRYRRYNPWDRRSGWRSGYNDHVPTWVSPDLWSSAWSSSGTQLFKGRQVCVTCYPTYMREDLGYRCSGTGLLNIETRWRAIQTEDCHGRFSMVNLPRRACTCSRGSSSFIFV